MRDRLTFTRGITAYRKATVALAGTMDLDLVTEPLATDPDGQPVYLRDLWPTSAEVNGVVESALESSMFREAYGRVYDGDELWLRALVAEPNGSLVISDEIRGAPADADAMGVTLAERLLAPVVDARVEVTQDGVSRWVAPTDVAQTVLSDERWSGWRPTRRSPRWGRRSCPGSTAGSIGSPAAARR